MKTYLYFIAFYALSLYSLNLSAKDVNLHVVNTMQRIFPDTDLFVSGDPEINMWTAKNEYHSVQIAILVNRPVNLTSVSVTDFITQDGRARIPSDNCTIRMPDYVYVEWNTRATPENELDGTAPALYPDPLPLFVPQKISSSRSLWLTCFIPSDSAAVKYSAVLRILIDDDFKQLPLTLNVWDFKIPDESSLFVSNWLHVNQLVKHYNLKLYSAQFWELINHVALDMKQHRLNVIRTRLNLIKAIKLDDGGYRFDFSHYEKWVNIFLRHNFKAIEAGPFLHPSAFNIISNDKKVRFRNKQETSEFIQSEQGKIYLVELLKALHKKNIELGINDKYLQHIGDEAKPSERALYRDLANLVRQYMPGVVTIDATHLDDSQRAGMMDLPVTNMFADEANQVNENARKWGKWWYTAAFRPRGSMPNRFIDYPLIKLRIIPWLNWRYGMKGYLHYAYNWWQLPDNESPWDKVQYKKYAPGDAWIVYPPRNSSVSAPVPSLRWEVFRDGLEDYEYLVLMKENIERMRDFLKIKPGSKAADDIKVSIVEGEGLLDLVFDEIKNKEQYTRNPARLYVIRYRIGEWLNNNSQLIVKHNLEQSVL